jgi:hypothetical protein
VRTSADDSAERIAAAADAAVRRLIAELGQEVPEPVLASGTGPDCAHQLTAPASVILAPGEFTLNLPASWADEATVLSVAAEILGRPGEASVRAERAERTAGPDFWRRRADGWADPLPEVFVRSGDQERGLATVGDASTGWVSASVPDEVTTRITADLSNVLLAAWQVALRQRIGGGAVVVGVRTDLRGLARWRDRRGPLSVYLPTRAEVGLDRPFDEHVAVMAGHAADGAAHAGDYDWTLTPAEPPNFGFSHTAVLADVLELNARPERFALRLASRSQGNALRLRVEYDADAVDADLAAGLTLELGAILADVPRHSRRPAGELGNRGQ